MRIFLTGATGFIGTAVTAQLIAAGHQVTGLTRSQQGAERLAAASAHAHFGDLEDHDSLRRGAMLSDGIIHTAFDHDFSRFMANCEKDRLAIAAMADALQGTQRPLVITSGVAMGSAGQNRLAVEDYFNPEHQNPRKASEQAAMAALEQGVNVSVVRLSQVHDTSKQGLITPLIEIARQKGVSAYVGEGENRWSAVHISDAALLYVRALEKHRPGRYHAVAEEGITLRKIAETIGQRLNVPVVRLEPSEAADHFGWMSHFVVQDMSASSALTQEQLNWQPQGPDLMSDLQQMRLV
ncbi:SDR family oxidoreductase [Enterobacter sp.]|uniref:SDR family oxidoreductase n=1 Tax=Enterobacter sp. TaxID=42895 RepID=UPI00296F989B|nr:SDR family oxidoreductase [Enterobacter sp.]